MTTQEIIDYYANLLILQYVGKPKAYATIQTLVEPVIMDQLPTTVMNGYALGTAIGVQLDVLGEYVGAIRTGINSTNGYFVLSDADFTKLIILAAAVNTSNASLESIQYILHTFFNGEIFVDDFETMRLSYLVSQSGISDNLLSAMIEQGFLPRPLGVELGVVYIPRIPFFSFTNDGAPYADYQCGFRLDTQMGSGSCYWIQDTDNFTG